MEPAEQPDSLTGKTPAAERLHAIRNCVKRFRGNAAGAIYAQLARTRAMSGRMRSRATSRETPDISRES